MVLNMAYVFDSTYEGGVPCGVIHGTVGCCAAGGQRGETEALLSQIQYGQWWCLRPYTLDPDEVHVNH